MPNSMNLSMDEIEKPGRHLRRRPQAQIPVEAGMTCELFHFLFLCLLLNVAHSYAVENI